MTMRAASDPAAHDWILHTPYAEPDRHWELDDHGRATSEIAPGRRPSSTQLPVPNPTGGESDWKPPNATVEPHATINEIREHVRAWQAAGWPHVGTRVRHLLEYWAQEGSAMRPFWCQREAVETLIWLFEAGRSHAPAGHVAIRKRIDATNRQWNDDISRVATKMATGTGKTNVMAMIALWWAVRHPEGKVHFLALVPGMTIRERLKVLASHESEIWRSIAPRGFEDDVRRMRWSIINFQAFQWQSELDVGGKATGKEKQLLYGPMKRSRKNTRKTASRPTPELGLESEAKMLDRLLKTHRGGGQIVVMNDEAHHCYTLRNVDRLIGSADDREEEEEDRKRAELWFNALRAIRSIGRLDQVFDFSATPMWLRRPASLCAETFPWTVSDFSLIDAVESGLVKVPRVPVSDVARDKKGQLIHLQPRFRNVYLYNDRQAIGDPLSPNVQEALHQLYEHYERETVPGYAETGHTPVMIVVANTIENATALHRYIAGHNAGSKEHPSWRSGHLPLFSNVDQTGSMKSHPPTILVHSRLDETADGQGGAIEQAIADQAALFAPGAETAKAKRKAIRDVFMSVGRDGPGRSIRCVISVGMLTEGWDARNVTHVFGYRAFGSQLLCEQVAGRALRKTAFNGKDEPQSIEYANLFGVPFAWLGGQDAAKPPPAPVALQAVYTVPGRDHLRLRFPHLAGYVTGRGRPRWRIEPQDVRGCRVRPRPVGSVIEGPVGESITVQTKPDDDHAAVWKAAAVWIEQIDKAHQQIASGPPDQQWCVSHDGLDALASQGRLIARDKRIGWKRYEEEVPGRQINNLWREQQSSSDLHYVVETAEATIERCMLMTTDPGDLVLDPTCESGTSAAVAEAWGRRWITIDASAIPVALCRQRILSTVHKWYLTLDDAEGQREKARIEGRLEEYLKDSQPIQGGADPSSGFIYERVPYVSAGHLAYRRPAKETILVDRPLIRHRVKRISSRFTVESHSPWVFVSPSAPDSDERAVEREIRIRENIVDTLKVAGILTDDGDERKRFAEVELWESGDGYITHYGTLLDSGQRVAIATVADDQTAGGGLIDAAAREAAKCGFSMLVVIAFHFEADVKSERRGTLEVVPVRANRDLTIGGLQPEREDDAFILVGEPNVELIRKRGGGGGNEDVWQVEIKGYNVYDPGSGNVRPSGRPEDIDCWMLDTDYDGKSFFARRIHFPAKSSDRQIKRLKMALGARLDPDQWAFMESLTSAPFRRPERWQGRRGWRVAVRIVTTFGDEMLTVLDVDEDE